MATIKDNLIQMKNTSELMVDLAYSAAFLRDKKLVREVMLKDEEMRKLKKETLKLLFKVKIPEDDLLSIMELTDSIIEIAGAAKNIAKLAEAEHYPPILRDILRTHKVKSSK